MFLSMFLNCSGLGSSSLILPPMPRSERNDRNEVTFSGAGGSCTRNIKGAPFFSMNSATASLALIINCSIILSDIVRS